MNRSKDLRALFRKSIRGGISSSVYSPYSQRSEYSAYLRGVGRSPMYGSGGYSCGGYASSISFSKEVCIYFYEWSDVTRQPRIFADISAFESFLRSCGISLELYGKDIINNLGKVYVSCYPKSKTLCFRSSYGNLKDSLTEYQSNELVKSVIPSTSRIQAPKVEYVGEEGTFFG